ALAAPTHSAAKNIIMTICSFIFSFSWCSASQNSIKRTAERQSCVHAPLEVESRAMSKTLRYRLFKSGAMPQAVRAEVNNDQLLFFDEGIRNCETQRNCARLQRRRHRKILRRGCDHRSLGHRDCFKHKDGRCVL